MKQLRKSHTRPCICEKKPYHSNRNIRQFTVNRNVNPNHNLSNPNRVNQNWQSMPKHSTNPHGRNSPDRYGMPTKCQSQQFVKA